MNLKLFCVSKDNKNSYALDRQKIMGTHSYKKIAKYIPAIEVL